MLFSTKSVYILCIYTVKGTICHFQASMLGVCLGYGWGMLGGGLDGISTSSVLNQYNDGNYYIAADTIAYLGLW